KASDVMRLLALEVPRPPVPDSRIAEFVRPIDQGIDGDGVPFALDSHSIAIPGHVPFVLGRISVRRIAAAFALFILELFDPFPHCGIDLAELASISGDSDIAECESDGTNDQTDRQRDRRPSASRGAWAQVETRTAFRDRTLPSRPSCDSFKHQN